MTGNVNLNIFFSPLTQNPNLNSVCLWVRYTPKAKKFIDKTFEEKVEKWGKHETF